MTEKHTQGLWVAMPLEPGKGYIRIRGTTLGRRFKIANVLIPVFRNGVILDAELEETMANAKLIAASTLMYKTLKSALKDMDKIDLVCKLAGVHNFDLMRKDLQTAISTASGKI